MSKFGGLFARKAGILTKTNRQQMECSVVEGALETARKDFARLMREAMALQREQAAPDDPARLRPANAA